MNTKWAINWIASILAINATYFYFYPGNLSGFLSELILGFFNFWSLVWIVLGIGTASMGYGCALLLQRLIMKGNTFRDRVFLIISLPLSIGLSILTTGLVVIRMY